MKVANEFCRNKDDSIATEYGKVITQVSCDNFLCYDKVFSIGPALMKDFYHEKENSVAT